MYITTALMNKWLHRPFLPRMHFKEIMSMRIKNRLKGNKENLNSAYCVQELSSMVACMKRTDFDEGPCSKEILVFQECVVRESKRITELRKAMQEGAVDPDAVRLSNKQLNALMQKWPVPGARIKNSWILPPNTKYEDMPF